MKNTFYVMAFILAVAMAYAASQTAPAGAPQQQSNPGYSQPTMPDTHDMGVPADQDKAATQTKDSDKHAAVDDSEIQKQVAQQMAAHNFNAVGVAVEKGVVTLSGAVATKEDRKRARELAKAVPGVTSVHEKLTVDSAAATALPVTAAPGSSPAGAATSGSLESQQNTSGSIAGNASATNSTQAGNAATQPAASGQAAGSTGGVTGAATGVSGGATTTTGTSTGVSGQATGTTGTSTGISGSATSATGTTAGAGAGTMTTEEGGDLQGRIESALKSEPTLSGSSVMANVTGDTIELSGSVPTGKEKQTANRIASSFAGNRKVVDRITVTGRGVGANTGTNPNPQGADQNQQPPQTPKH